MIDEIVGVWTETVECEEGPQTKEERMKWLTKEIKNQQKDENKSVSAFKKEWFRKQSIVDELEKKARRVLLGEYQKAAEQKTRFEQKREYLLHCQACEEKSTKEMERSEIEEKCRRVPGNEYYGFFMECQTCKSQYCRVTDTFKKIDYGV